MITLLVILVVVGAVLWFIGKYVPLDPPFKAAIYLIAVIFLLLYVLQFFGLINAPSLR